MADPIQLTLVLRPPAASAAIGEQLLSGTYDPGELNPSDLSADAGEVQAVTDFAKNNGLQVESVDPAARTVRVSGSADAIQKAFGIQGGSQGEGSVQSLDYRGPIQLPPSLQNVVIAVLGLDQRPIARHHGGGQ